MDDPKSSFKTPKKPNYKDEQGYEFEWDEQINGYVPILTESLIQQNQNNYEYVPEEYGTDEQGNVTYTNPENGEVWIWREPEGEPDKESSKKSSSLSEGLDDGSNSSDDDEEKKKTDESDKTNKIPRITEPGWYNSKNEKVEFTQTENKSSKMFQAWTYNESDSSYSDQYGQKWFYDYLRCKYLNEDGWFLIEDPIKENSLEAIEPDSGNHYRFDGESKKWVELEPEEEEELADRSLTEEQRKAKEEEKKKKSEQEKENKKKKKRKNNEWVAVDEDKQTTVYVTGLPPATITVQTFENLMKKYGIIKIDPVTNQPKIKIYKDRQTGCPKGDAICTFAMKESVDLAIQLLHDSPCPLDENGELGLICTVEKAKFEQKGDSFDHRKNKKRRKLTKKEKLTLDKRKEKMMAWNEKDEMTNAIEMDIERSMASSSSASSKPSFVNKKILIFKNVFNDPKIFNSKSGQFLTEKIRVTLRTLINTTLSRSVQFENEEAQDRVKKIILFDRHKEGVCSVAFKNTKHAEYLKSELEGKMFICQGVVPGILKADYWDGETNYMVEETKDELEERDKGWMDFLEGKE